MEATIIMQSIKHETLDKDSLNVVRFNSIIAPRGNKKRFMTNKLPKEKNQIITFVEDEEPPKKKHRKGRSPVNCAICHKALTSEANLKRHLRSTHSKPTDYICDYEGRHFRNKNTLRLHILQHRVHFRIKCEVCSKEYTTNQSIRKHLRTHFELYQCEQCGASFQRKVLLTDHTESVHKAYESFDIKCNYCTRMFSTVKLRNAHQVSIHPDKKVNSACFKCPECPCGFEMREELRLHTFIHYEGEIYTCNECHQIFKKKRLLNSHMKGHNMPMLQCDVCQAMFTLKTNLRKHKNRCRGAKVVKSKEDLARDAEIAKRQFIAITVGQNSLRFEEEPDEEVYADTCETIVNVETPQETPEDEEYEDPLTVKIEKEDETIAKKSQILRKTSSRKKRKYQKTKPPDCRIIKTSAFYECDFCNFQTPTKDPMLRHIRRHVRERRHSCKNCTETFQSLVNLHKHSLKVHGRGVFGSAEYNKAATCPLCNKSFSEERLKYHMKLHSTESFTCDECPRVFKSKSSLEAHILKSHLDERKFICPTCGKSFKSTTSLKMHEEIHNPVQTYVKCDICDRMMLMKSWASHVYRQHTDKYKEKPFVCHCSKAFHYEKQLKLHVARVHEKTSRGISYNCSECSKSFNRRLDLKDHTLDFHCHKVFECDCGKKFKTQKLLRLHAEVHTDKKYPCEICGAQYLTRSGRSKHRIRFHETDAVEVPGIKE